MDPTNIGLEASSYQLGQTVFPPFLDLPTASSNQDQYQQIANEASALSRNHTRYDWAPLCPKTTPFGWGPYQPNQFDLTPCFEDATVNLIPVAILFVMGLVEIYKLRNVPERLRDGKKLGWRNGLRWSKVALTTVIVALQISYLVLAILISTQPGQDVLVYSNAVILGAYLLAIPFHWFSHTRLPRSSTPLLFFWLTTICASVIRLRTLINLPKSSPLSLFNHSSIGKAAFIIFCVQLGFKVVIFSLELLNPEGGGKEFSLKGNSKVGYSYRGGEGVNGDAEEVENDVDKETETDGHHEAPFTRANIFERLTFTWMTPMMKLGYRKYLTEDDLWALPKQDQADSLSERLRVNWEDQMKKKKKPSLTLALFKAYGKPFFVAALFKAVHDVLAFAQPQLLRKLLSFVSSYSTSDPQPAYQGYIIALGMFLCSLLQTAFLHQYFQRVIETGMRVRGGLVCAIYRKALVLSNEERKGRQTGDIVNLQSTDTTRLQDVCNYGQIAWSGTFQIILAFISLYNLMGWPMMAGLAVMILTIPLNGFIARYQTKLQRGQMKNKDARTRMMSEILNNIRSIKLYSWENAFAQRLFKIRNDRELVQLKKMGLLSSFSTFLWNLTPFLVAFASFTTYALTVHDKPLTSEIVFPALSLFQLIQFPLNALPAVFASLVEAYVSIGRLSSFLNSAELQKDAVKIEVVRDRLMEGDELISVQKGEFSWTAGQSEPTLHDINLSLKKGQLIAVVGRVGSGKSSLLSALLGEMTRTEGSVKLRGKVAYVSQTAWITGGTVKDNIVFGHKFDQQFYDMVLDACALRDDLAILKDGDETEVGEKGITLSGGQKARLSLARAVYARADIYLFDDPLSAVDAHVARHLFDQVIGPEGLLASKARLLCTNAIPFIQQADEMIMLRKGVILERGTYSGVVGGDSEIAKLLSEFGKSESGSNDSDSEGTQVATDEPKEMALANGDVKGRRFSSKLTRRASEVPIDKQKRATLRSLKRSTRPKEHQEKGSVKTHIYRNYLKANGIIGVALFIFTIALQQALGILTNIWLKNWSQHNADIGADSDVYYYLGVYFAFGLATAICFLLNGIILYTFCVIRAARMMHDSMYRAVLRSPMLFFETTPIGTILNRFSRDVYVIDEVLARVFSGFFRTFSVVIGVVVVIGGSAPPFLIVVLPLFFIYKRIQTYYLATSRELKRLDATTKSPIFASFQETLGGLSTIRAYRQQGRFIAENEARLDRNQEAYYPSISCNRWLAVRLEFIGSIIILCAAVLAVFSLLHSKTVDAGLVGLMMSYALSTTQALNWIVRSATEVETNIVSVERVQQYIDLEPEAPLEIPEKKPPAAWPERGSVHFEDLSLRYREGLDLVLKDITVDIKGEDKVGVCGRTGAGKSSLTMALYRVVEPASGTIYIDGVDITKIGLHDLRSRLSIIPQDSQCFEGSMRENLDPEGNASDTELWRALEQSRLKEHVESMEGGLDAHLDEGGSNLSAGQRQLMCLARALLRQSKILVLDEATSAVDPESDKQIQAVIRREFSNCTIIVIAHRLNTIMDCDKILVMDKGQVAEYDAPSKLLESIDGGLFYSLAKEAGLVKN